MAMPVVATGPAVNGERVRRFNEAMFAQYGRTCHLCGGPGADTADHILPTSTHPHMRWDLANVRPAHHQCNSERKAAPLADSWTAPGW